MNINQAYLNEFNGLLNDLMKLDIGFKEIHEKCLEIDAGNVFLAGGVVRDLFRYGKSKPKDIDIFISDTGFKAIEEIINSQGRRIENPFGTIRWFPNKKDEFYYDIIIIEKFKNGLWVCEDIIDVLNQFDFTANAIAFDLKTGDFYNPLNGLKHIKKKEFRAVRFDYPEMPVSDTIPISRNSVLWFRYKYYARKLDLSIEPLTAKWIEDNAHRNEDLDTFSKFFFNPMNV